MTFRRLANALPRARNWLGAAFVALLTYVGEWGRYIGSVLSWPIRRALQTLDPLDRLSLPWSHVQRAGYRSSLIAPYALALVAMHLLPHSAHAYNTSTHQIQHVIVDRLGGASPLALRGLVSVIGATASKDTRLPFRYGTIKRRQNIGTFTMTLGQNLPAVKIPQVGMLARVLYDVEGSYTVATAPLVVAFLATLNNTSDGMDALFQKANISLNNGSASIVDMSGVGVNIINANLNPSLPIKRGVAGTGNVQGSGFGLAVGAQTFSYKGILPINANQRRQFEMGLLNLQASEVQATINMSFNSSAVIFTTPANFTVPVLTINFSYEYYEIPPLNKYKLPPMTIVRTLEEAPQAINAVGLQIYQLPRLGTMIELHSMLVLNNAYSNVGLFGGTPTTAKISEWALKYNLTDTQLDTFIGDLETYEAELYGSGVGPAITPSAASDGAQTWLNPSGITFNTWCAGDRERNGGDFRDAIDTEENTTTQVLITIAAGTALNAGKDNLFHVRRVVQRIVPVAAPAQAA